MVVSAKSKCLHNAIKSEDLLFLMEAHNGISAKIAEVSGFQAIWASGLSISAALGVRDRNEASWTQVLEVVEFMNDAVSVPILLDGDSGYGDENNVARLVKKLCQRDISGVCIEDKIFPKRNSFAYGEQSLISVSEFTDKVKAAKDAQTNPDFTFVARTETLIAGGSIQEAIDRAGCYHQAGADAILIHSKRSAVAEIEEFCHQWQNTAPIIVVPTKYSETPTETFKMLNVAAIIWANHGLRASISALFSIYRHIRKENSVAGLDKIIASVDDIFDLTGEKTDGKGNFAK